MMRVGANDLKTYRKASFGIKFVVACIETLTCQLSMKHYSMKTI